MHTSELTQVIATANYAHFPYDDMGKQETNQVATYQNGNHRKEK